MALIVYNKENSRPQQVVYQGKRTINMDSKGTVYLSKTMSIELGILGGGRVNFAHDEDTGEWYICHTTDKDGFTVWKDKRCARFSAILCRIHRQKNHASGKSGKEDRTVYDCQGSHRGGVQYITRFCFPIRFSNSKKKMAQKDPLSDNGDGFFRAMLFGFLHHTIGSIRILFCQGIILA